MVRQRNATVVRPSGVPDHTGEQQGVGGSAWNPWLTASATLLVPVGAEEFYDNVRGASRLLPGSLARDLVCELELRLWCDRSAAMGILHHRVCGNVRHLGASSLWVKRAVKDKTLAVEKVQGKLNMANTETKHLDRNPL